MLNNLPAYRGYEALVKTGSQTIMVNEINKNNWEDHLNAIFNIFNDAIETEEFRNMKVTLNFDGKVACSLHIPDYLFNLIMWRMIVFSNNTLKPKHLFFPERLTQKSIASYINDNLVRPNRKSIDNRALNNIIDDTLHTFKRLDNYAMYFGNTLNITDDVLMMKAVPRYREIMNADLSNIPLEHVKDEGMKLTDELISYIVDSKKYLGFDHCLANAFRSGESIRPRQYKEANVNIGTKPDGTGSVFPHITNHSFINGGVSSNIDYFIDASNGRTAQILSKNNVGTSGSYARILGLNSIDTVLHEDPHYACDTRNLTQYTVLDKEYFKLIIDRYFRWEDGGTSEDDILVTEDMADQLIGKTIWLRSPMTCASAARGEGVCYRCYGDTAYTNIYINIGKFAAEVISSKLTQRLLSAKHLLETKIDEIKWTNGFFDVFELNGNIVRLIPNLVLKNSYLSIDPSDIILENEDDEIDESNAMMYNEYIKKFSIVGNDKDIASIENIATLSDDNLYISNTLNMIIKSKAESADGKILVPLSSLVDQDIFFINIQNNELSKAMNRLIDLLNKQSVTMTMNRHQLLQAFNEAIIKGGLGIMSVHGEILIMNQIRSADNILEKVDWTIPKAAYQLLTLNKALFNHPSVNVTLLYNYLNRVLYSPLTFKKTGVSFVDLFFMKQPQKFIKSDPTLVSHKKFKSDVEENAKPMYIKLAPPDVDNSIL